MLPSLPNDEQRAASRAWSLLCSFPMSEQISENEIRQIEVSIPETKTGAKLKGTLRIPPAPIGWVIFAHGSGSSRLSPRNTQVARALNQNHMATLLFDLLTPEESENRKNIFDIPLLAERLLKVSHWLKKSVDYNGAPLGFFGASTGAAATILASTVMKGDLRAVVSRGGRVDLARSSASEVPCKTLLIVGAWDEPVLTWNRETLPLIPDAELKVIPRATHLFEEPHALPAVIESATAFFLEQFRRNRQVAPERNLLQSI